MEQNLKYQRKREQRMNMQVYSKMVKEFHPPRVSPSKQAELREILIQR